MPTTSRSRIAATLGRRFTFANVVSMIALFVALGGTSVAAVTLKRNSVKGKHIAASAVTSKKVKDGTLTVKDFAGGQLAAANGQPGPKGADGAKGEDGAPGPGAIPLSIQLTEGSTDYATVDLGSWRLAANCSSREDRAQVQIFGYSEGQSGNGTLQWIGIRSHSAEGTFETSGGTDLDTGFRGLESRWAPAGGWAAEGLDLQYRSGSKATTVSLHMMADERGSGAGECTVAGTAVSAG